MAFQIGKQGTIRRSSFFKQGLANMFRWLADKFICGRTLPHSHESTILVLIAGRATNSQTTNDRTFLIPDQYTAWKCCQAAFHRNDLIKTPNVHIGRCWRDAIDALQVLVAECSGGHLDRHARVGLGEGKLAVCHWLLRAVWDCRMDE